MRLTATKPLTLALATALTFAFTLGACSEKEAPGPAPGAPAAPAATDDSPKAKAKAKAAAALMPLKKGLGMALKGAITKGGPIEALSVCRDEAPAIAAKASTGGVVVGRISDKPRNPKNVARDWMKPLLARYAGSKKGGAPPAQVVALDDGGFGYVEPIFTQDLCLTCHGATVGPELETKLTELYPHDRARGYAPGDFRGLFWAEVSKDAIAD